MGPAIEKVRAAQVAAMMVRIFMGFLDLSVGWPSFFIVSSGLCRPADYGHRTGQSRGMKSTWGPGSIINTARVARTHATRGNSHRHVEVLGHSHGAVRHDVDPVRLVGEARFLKHDADLHPIGRRAEKSCSRSAYCAGQRVK